MSYAGILASSTRVIYSQNAPEKSLMLVNTNEYPVLTQIWVDDGQMDSEFQDAPFAVLPGVFKLNPKETKGIRIVYNGTPLASDRESLYWLNLYEIPAIKKDNLTHDYVNLAMNTQMKIFYRPKNLQSFTLNELQQKIKHELISSGNKVELTLKNPTPYYLNFTNIKVSNAQFSSDIQHKDDNILPPFSEKTYALINANFQIKSTNLLEYTLIDDSGKSHPYSYQFK
jgi:P pilus assembly chaperone PapD